MATDQEFLEQQVAVTQFLPDDAEATDADEEFDALDEVLDSVGVDPDLIVTTEELPPLGRSWAYDLESHRFATGEGKGPLETHGLATLKGWIAKALTTELGASPIYPDGYGIDGLAEMFGAPLVAVANGQWESEIRRCLMYHPRITDITDFQVRVDQETESVWFSFVVEVDGEPALTIADIAITS